MELKLLTEDESDGLDQLSIMQAQAQLTLRQVVKMFDQTNDLELETPWQVVDWHNRIIEQLREASK